MLAETLREAGLLFSVFGLIDAILAKDADVGVDKVTFIIATTGGGILLIIAGMWLERNRTE